MSLYEMRNTVAGRVTGALAAFALVVGLSFGGAVAAQADDTSDLQAEIDRLLTLIEQLQSQLGGSTVTPPAGDFTYTFTRNLTIGATGEDVRMLQRYLNRNAATQVAPAGVAGGSGAETSYYGPATAAAVKKYQELHAADILHPLGLTVGTPNFGVSTRAFMNAEIAKGGSTTTPGTPGTPGTDNKLEGGEGLIEAFDFSVDTDMKTGDTEVIYEFEVEASDSDVAINRVDIMFDSRPWLLFDEVALLANGKEVGTLSRQRDYTGSANEWRARFSGLDVVVREGRTVEFTVEATAVSALRGGSPQDVDVWTEDNAVRAVDALGLVQYADGFGYADRVNVEIEDNFGAGTLSVSNNNSPKATTFTEGDRDPVVLAFRLNARDSNITVEKIKLAVTDANKVLRRLSIDGTSVRVNGSGTYTFDFGRRGLDVREGRSVNLEVVAEFDNDKTGSFSVALNGTDTVEAIDADYQPSNASSTLGSGVSHQFVNEDSFSVVREGSVTANFYRAPTDTARGRIGIEFTVTAANTASGDVDIDVTKLVENGTAAADTLVYTLTGASGNVDAELRSENGTILTGVQTVSAGSRETFRLYVYFDDLDTTAVLNITDVDQNAVTDVYVQGE